MGFRLVQSDLTSNDLEGSQTKVTVFDVKYVENSKSYDVGPNGGYVDISSLDLLPKIFGLLVTFVRSVRPIFQNMYSTSHIFSVRTVILVSQLTVYQVK